MLLAGCRFDGCTSQLLAGGASQPDMLGPVSIAVEQTELVVQLHEL